MAHFDQLYEGAQLTALVNAVDWNLLLPNREIGNPANTVHANPGEVAPLADTELVPLNLYQKLSQKLAELGYLNLEHYAQALGPLELSRAIHDGSVNSTTNLEQSWRKLHDELEVLSHQYGNAATELNASWFGQGSHEWVMAILQRKAVLDRTNQMIDFTCSLLVRVIKENELLRASTAAPRYLQWILDTTMHLRAHNILAGGEFTEKIMDFDRIYSQFGELITKALNNYAESLAEITSQLPRFHHPSLSRTLARQSL